MSEPSKPAYRQRPLEAEAVQWTGANADQLRAFAGSDFDTIAPQDRIEDPDQDAQLLVEDSHWVGIGPGDWVLRFEGYFVAKSDAAFRAVWEPAVSSPAPADRAALRDRIAEALANALKPRYGGPQHNTPGGLPLTATAEEVRLHRAQPLADAVLDVLPAPAETELRRELAASERIRANADFHLGQEMSRRQLAEKETGRLRAVVARLRQMTDYWEQQLPDVIRTPAVVSAIRAALEAADDVSRMVDEAPPPVDLAAAPDPTPLRWGLNDTLWGDDDTVTVLLSGPAGEPYWLALDPERAAVLREDLAGPDGAAIVDRAAVLDEAANALAALGPEDSLVSGAKAWVEAVETLRRLAGEARGERETQAEAHPAEHTWAAELHDPLADEWVPGTRYLARDRAVNALAHARRIGPTWKDGTPTQRRLVRATTTYTVETGGAAVAQQPEPGVVAYRSSGARVLRCLTHAPVDLAGFTPVTSEDLPDGGICTYSTCGADVLIPQQPEAAEGAQQ